MRVVSSLALLSLLATMPAPKQARASRCAPCANPTVRHAVTVRAPDLSELSGLAASALHQGIYWAHTDSGGRPELYALDDSGAVRVTLALQGAQNVDWEDIAAAPCGAARCLYVADTGDNRATRASVALYRVHEPLTLPAQPGTTVSVAAERLELRYPDGAHDVEALVVDPATGTTAWLLTKSLTAPRLYRVELSATGPLLAQYVGAPGVPGVLNPITAASAHPCEARVLVRTYLSLWECAGATLEAALLGSCRDLGRPPDELQGEAVSWMANGQGWVTAAESGSASVAPVLHTARCR